jgi:hypothetical protein
VKASRRSRVLLGTGVIAVLAAAVAAAGVQVATGTHSASPPLPRLGPARDVYDGDLGDPFVLRTGSSYVLFGTDDPPDHIPTAQAAGLTGWQRGPDALPVLPAWANPDPGDSLTWAPAVLRTTAAYLMYVSVQELASRRECIAVVSADTGYGPYHDARGAPLVCQRELGGSIDPSVVADRLGGLHLVWKSDGNCCGLPSSIWTQSLASNGLALTGSPRLLLTADEQWQGGIVENPALLQAAGGGWWLFYSGNRFDSSAYATGLAYCATLTARCRETSAQPFLSGTATQYAPGGLDFFHDGSGTVWAAFATWNRPARNGRFYCCRSVNIAPFLGS